MNIKIAYDQSLDEELLKVIEENPRNFIKCIKSKGFKGRYENRCHLINYIMKCTPMLVDDANFTYTLKTRLFWVVNKMQDWDDDRVKCAVCKKPIKHYNVKKLKDGYKKTCSKECERKLAQQHLEKRLVEEHGVKNAFQLKEVIEKLNAEKEDIQRKRDETKRKNKTFKTSKREDEAYEVLCNAFTSDDIIRQFKDERYPFNCDFYIKSRDLFIECNFSWTHCQHWFDENDKDDLAKVECMREKHSKYYDNAIETWTVRDVKKRECAERNKLNYLVFWTLNDLKAFQFA